MTSNTRTQIDTAHHHHHRRRRGRARAYHSRILHVSSLRRSHVKCVCYLHVSTFYLFICRLALLLLQPPHNHVRRTWFHSENPSFCAAAAISYNIQFHKPVDWLMVCVSRVLGGIGSVSSHRFDITAVTKRWIPTFRMLSIGLCPHSLVVDTPAYCLTWLWMLPFVFFPFSFPSNYVYPECSHPPPQRPPPPCVCSHIHKRIANKFYRHRKYFTSCQMNIPTINVSCAHKIHKEFLLAPFLPPSHGVPSTQPTHTRTRHGRVMGEAKVLLMKRTHANRAKSIQNYSAPPPLILYHSILYCLLKLFLANKPYTTFSYLCSYYRIPPSSTHLQTHITYRTTLRSEWIPEFGICGSEGVGGMISSWAWVCVCVCVSQLVENRNKWLIRYM